MGKIIEKNEFGIKRTDNRLCLVCRKYVLKKDWKKHLAIKSKKDCCCFVQHGVHCGHCINFKQ